VPRGRGACGAVTGRGKGLFSPVIITGALRANRGGRTRNSAKEPGNHKVSMPSGKGPERKKKVGFKMFRGRGSNLKGDDRQGVILIT